MKKCYYKPTRSAPRYFTPCDVARIAQNCIDDSGGDVTPLILMAVVGKQLGFTHIATSVIVNRDTAERSPESKLVRLLEQVRDELDKVLRALGLDV